VEDGGGKPVSERMLKLGKSKCGLLYGTSGARAVRSQSVRYSAKPSAAVGDEVQPQNFL
jgi:hypothetical protein